MATSATFQWSVGVALAFLAFCHGSHGPRVRPSASLIRPLLVLETEQDLGQDAAMLELDQLLNLLQANKGKRSQDQDKVLQPGSGGTGMWFGPRLGRRRRRSARPASAGRRKRSPPQLGRQDVDVDNALIPWKLAELLREMQGPKRSPAPCDPSEINCLLANFASSAAGYASSEEQRPRSEGNVVNFTPRLGRDSGEQAEDAAEERDGLGDKFPTASSRQLRTDGEPVWGFSPRLGRRLLPPGAMDVHAPSGVPPPSAGPVDVGVGVGPQGPEARSRPRAGRATRSTAPVSSPGSATNPTRAQ